ncbi:hypothetical protein DdX_03859 [Ditylenchus destructor]|uniref:Uncharacterized protein n=1 Tax=Ditylenchus destructor TaxID=166010 RepID=A0AAD4NG22_9BILA|nr:hypothetical protein DdX_03859 [Ditylenchus destructor]
MVYTVFSLIEESSDRSTLEKEKYESIGTHACVELRNRRPYHFRTRCKTDADFGMLQCCLTCRTDISKLGQELFSQGTRSRHCFDRHNRKFCQHFVHQGGMWAANQKKQVSCNGESASLAFRICRRSCGFCNPNLYEDDRKSTKCPTNIAISTAPKNAKNVTVIYPGIGGGQVSVTTEIAISIKLPSTNKTKQVTGVSSLPTQPTTPALPLGVGSPEPPLVMPPPQPVVFPPPTLPPSTQRPPQPPHIFPEPWWPSKPYVGPQPLTITWRPVPNPWPVPPYPSWPTQTDTPPSATNWPQPWDQATQPPISISHHVKGMLEEIMDIELDLDSSSGDLLQEILLDDIK